MVPGLPINLMDRDLPVGGFTVNFNPAVSLSSLTGIIVSNRAIFTVSDSCHPVRRDAFADQVVHHSLSPVLRKFLVACTATYAVSMSFDTELYVRVVIKDIGNVIQNCS